MLMRKNEVSALKTDSPIPEESCVIGIGFVMDAEKVKVCCTTCKRQPLSVDGFIDVEKLFEKAVTYKRWVTTCGGIFAPVEKIKELEVLTEFKCYACGTMNAAPFAVKQKKARSS
jgi:hypothetical protein